MASIFHGLRRAAPRLSQNFIISRQCINPSRPALDKVAILKGSTFQRNVRFNNVAANLDNAARKSSPVASLSQTIATPKAGRSQTTGDSGSTKNFFPDTSSRSVAFWLLGSAASVFGIVVFGGLTRLTESGLSITEWKPVTGSRPPLTLEDWQSEFDKYRASPEFRLLNPHMTMDEFKKIYYMEWGHRMWGRVLGLTFVIPAAIFVARRKVSANMSWRLLAISGLIGFQGVLGWWMVKSGLKDDLFAPGSHPRVSQYRLTAHLGAAFVCYIAMLWNGLSILRDAKLLTSPANGHDHLLRLSSPTFSIFRKSIAGLAILVFATAMSGGLVAGLDAGLIYNQFPRMGEGFAPPLAELFSRFYSRKEDGSDIWWRNMLENPSTVQLDHRIMATTTFTAIVGLWAYTRFNPKVRAALPPACRRGMVGVVHLAMLQVALGISTLIYLVPVPLAAAHQAGSLALLTWVLVLGSRTWVPKRTLKLLQSRMNSTKSATSHVLNRRIGL